MLILHYIPDITTLFNLIRASPTYYATVASSREKILTPIILHELEKVITPIILRELESRGIYLFRPVDALRLFMTSLDFSDEEIIATIHECVRHTEGQRATLRLSLRQCRLLRALRYAEGWSCLRYAPHHIHMCHMDRVWGSHDAFMAFRNQWIQGPEAVPTRMLQLEYDSEYTQTYILQRAGRLS